MVFIDVDRAAPVALAIFLGLYARWLAAAELGRQRHECEAKKMQQLYRLIEWQEKTSVAGSDAISGGDAATARMLHEVLAYEMRVGRKARQRFWRSLLFTILCFLLICGLLAAFAPRGFPAAVAWAALPFLLARYGEWRRVDRRIQKVLRLLHKYDCHSAAGTLIEAMEMGSEATSGLAANLLADTLPRMTPADNMHLENRHRTGLHRILRGSNSRLILAVLPLIERTGDARSIRLVKHLYPCPAWLGDHTRIEQAALRCLQRLQERQTLLRAGNLSSPAASVLLRSVRQTFVQERSLLLASKPTGTEQRTRNLKNSGEAAAKLESPGLDGNSGVWQDILITQVRIKTGAVASVDDKNGT